MRINRRTIIIVATIICLALVLGGVYLWYTNNYGNMKKIKVEDNTTLDYDWLNIASNCGITDDYLWARTKSLMLESAEDGTLIPSSLMIEGRLVTEPQEESGIYKLSDQALLLTMYVRKSDRFAAEALVSEVNNRFEFENESNYEKSKWLEAYIEFYNAFGRSSDYDLILTLRDLIFDENGNVRPEGLSVAGFGDSSYASLVDPEDNYFEASTFEANVGESQDSSYSFVGVELSSINLKLIRVLENNGLLPAGSFDANLNLVLDGIVSNDLALFAYAYEVLDDDSISYVNSYRHAASVDIPQSILTMRNLSEVGELPSKCYLWLKNTYLNSVIIYDTFYFMTGRLDGDEAVDSYTDILVIAICESDVDLFQGVCSRLGSRVATYNNSPALSMIYRSYEDRYIFFARENLDVAIALL